MRKILSSASFLLAVCLFVVNVSFGQSTPGVYSIKLLNKNGTDFSSSTDASNQSQLYYSNGDSTVYTYLLTKTSGNTGISHVDFIGLSCLEGKSFTVQTKTALNDAWTTVSSSSIVYGLDNAQSCTSSTDIMKVPQGTSTGVLYIKIKLNGGYYKPAVQVSNNVVIKVGGSGGACNSATTHIPSCDPTVVCNLSVSTSKTNVLCYSQSTGSIDLTVSGGSGTYSYTWSKSGGGYNFTSQDPTNLSAGTYSVTITDANNCSTSTSVVVSQPASAVTSSVDVPSIACNAGTTTITITGSGGTGELRYSINAGSYNQASNVFTGIYAGSYSVTVTDANGCSSTTKDVVISQPPVLTASASGTEILCNGGNSTITVSGNGGTQLDGGTYTNAGTYTVTAGTYNYTITDKNGCSATTSVTITEPTAVTSSVDVPSIACNAGTTTITITGSGGTGELRYSINAGSYNQASNVFTGIYAGSYSVTVTDANGCSSTTKDVVISQPPVLTASASGTEILCNGGNSTITVSGNGGTQLDGGTYTNAGTYTVTAGTYNYTITDKNGCSATTSVTITEPTLLTASASASAILCNGGSTTLNVTATGGKLGTYSGTGNYTVSAGGYSYTVTDGNGCTSTVTGTISEPSAITASITNADISCIGANDGTITISNASGGNGSFTYKLNSTISNLTGKFTNLSAGTYFVSVTDANQCSLTSSVTILEGKSCDPYYTYSQGYYGNKNYANVTANGGTITKVDFIKRAIKNGGGIMKLGAANRVTMGTYDATLAQIYDRVDDNEILSLSTYLPSGGTPGPLSATLDIRDNRLFNTDGSVKSSNSLIKNGKFNNTLFGQTVTMWINIFANPMLAQKTGNTKILEAFKDFDLSGLECKTSIVTTFPSAGNKINTGNELVVSTFPQNVIKYLVAQKYSGKPGAGTTLKDLVQLGMDALGQSSTSTGLSITYSNVKYSVTYAEITAALDAIVTAFHGGMFFKEFRGVSSCSKLVPPTTVTSSNQTTSSVAIEAISLPENKPTEIQTKVYPNPFTDKVNIRVTATKDGKASLILYNMSGQKVATIFEGEMKAGTQTFTYTIPTTQRHGLIFIFRQNGKAETGKLFGVNR
jgi:SprB repeat